MAGHTPFCVHADVEPGAGHRCYGRERRVRVSRNSEVDEITAYVLRDGRAEARIHIGPGDLAPWVELVVDDARDLVLALQAALADHAGRG